MQWLNEPSNWQRTADVITVSAEPGTDFWRETGYGYIRDSGHVYGEMIDGDLDVSVRIRGNFAATYDQAGIMLRADDRVWLKTGLEFFEGRRRLSTVVTLGPSSWMVADLPEWADEITLLASRRAEAVEVRYVVGEGPAELLALAYLPPGREVLAGIMCAAPEGPGFGVTFSDLLIRWAGDTEGVAGPIPQRGDAAAWAGDTRDTAGWEEESTGTAGWAGDSGHPSAGTAAGSTTPAVSPPEDADGTAPQGWDAGEAHSWGGSDEPGERPSSPGPGFGWFETPPDGDEPGGGSTAAEVDPAAGGEAPPASPETGAPAKPPPAQDAAPPPDPADEWISLLTADQEE